MCLFPHSIHLLALSPFCPWPQARGPGKGKASPLVQVCRGVGCFSLPTGHRRHEQAGRQAGSSISLSRACQQPGSVNSACEVTALPPCS